MNANKKMQGTAVSQPAKFEVWGKWMRLSFGVPPGLALGLEPVETAPLGGLPLIRVNSRDSRAKNLRKPRRIWAIAARTMQIPLQVARLPFAIGNRKSTIENIVVPVVQRIERRFPKP